MNTIDLSTGTAPDMWKCREPSCMRKIHVAAFYCCQLCFEADKGRYALDNHSSPCEQRSAYRGEYSPAEAVAMRQPGTRS